jgi:hypothetical protein
MQARRPVEPSPRLYDETERHAQKRSCELRPTSSTAEYGATAGLPKRWRPWAFVPYWAVTTSVSSAHRATTDRTARCSSATRSDHSSSVCGYVPDPSEGALRQEVEAFLA